MSTSVASVVSHFPDAENGFTTTTSGSVASGATTVGLASVGGYTNGQPAVFVIDPTDASKKQTFTGIIDTSGVQVTSVVWTAGTNQTHALGATVVDYATATHIAMISKGIQVSLNQDGTIKNNAITTAAQITDGVIGDAEMATAVKPVTLFNENTFDHIVSGCVWTADAAGSTLLGSMTSGVVMLAGKRLTVAAVTAHAFTASKDTYVDLRDNGDGTASIQYNAVTNNAASQALTAGDLRCAIVVTGAGSIAAASSINQGQVGALVPAVSSNALEYTDSLGNIIFPKDPSRRVIGRHTLGSGSGISGATDITNGATSFIVPAGGRNITVLAYVDVNGSTANLMEIDLKEGSTTLKSARQAMVGTGGWTDSKTLKYSVFASAGLHTYKLNAQSAAGGGTVTVNSSDIEVVLG